MMTDEEKARIAQREYMRKWRAENPEKVKGYQKRWRDQNKGKAAEIQRKWRLKNPEKSKEYQKRHYAKKFDEMYKI